MSKKTQTPTELQIPATVTTLNNSKQRATTLKSDTDTTNYIGDCHSGVGGRPRWLARASHRGRRRRQPWRSAM